MASSEAMTSSTRSFAYSYRLVKKCFVKICEASKCHNFLIFQPIFIRFSLFCSQNFTLSSEIKLNLFRSSPLMDLNKSIFWKVQHSHSRHKKRTSNLLRIILKGRLRPSNAWSLESALYINLWQNSQGHPLV